MSLDGSMTNQLLIAMPGMLDPNFSTTVTLICEHNEEGALGIVINRPLNLKMSGLFEQLDLTDPDPEEADRPVMMGGPVGTERGFVLHDTGTTYENTLAVSSEIQLTLSRDVIDDMASGEGPERSLVAAARQPPRAMRRSPRRARPRWRRPSTWTTGRWCAAACCAWASRSTCCC